MNNDRPRGIVDPWKRVDGLKPAPPKPVKEKRNIEDRDLDADLVEPGSYTLRSKHACFAITHVRVQSGKDAVDVLADCVYALFQDRQHKPALLAAGIGVETAGGVYNRPADETQASWVRGAVARIWFNAVTLDLGMLALAKILRKPTARKALADWGVQPMSPA